MPYQARPAIRSILLLAVCTAAALLFSASFNRASAVNEAAADTASAGEPACNIAMTRALYGFQCHGYADVGAGMEPVTFVGTVRGNGQGFFEGLGTFNSSGGSASTHVAGNGTQLPRCFGHVNYTTNEILLRHGGTVPLPPIAFDYTTVDSGNEILGTGVAAPAGGTGNLVPRLTCRLVRVAKK